MLISTSEFNCSKEPITSSVDAETSSKPAAISTVDAATSSISAEMLWVTTESYWLEEAISGELYFTRPTISYRLLAILLTALANKPISSLLFKLFPSIFCVKLPLKIMPAKVAALFNGFEILKDSHVEKARPKMVAITLIDTMNLLAF